MNQEQKERLAELKKRKKDELDALAFARQAIEPSLEILEELKQKESLANTLFMIIPQQEWLPTLQTLFQQEPYAKFDLSSIKTKLNVPLLEQLFEKYPSENSFRYVPDFPQLNDELGFKEIVQRFNLANETVYLYYLRYAFVFQISVSSLMKAEAEILFNLFHGDVVIFPENQDWLLAYSLEEEWRFGKEH